MAHPNVIAAVKAMLVDWQGPPIFDINTNGTTRDDTTIFIEVQFPASRVERVSIDKRYYREEGGVRFVVNTPRGLGIDDASTLCEQLASLFRDKTFARVHTLAPSSPVFDDSNDNAGWFETAFVVPFWYTYRD